MKKRLFALLSFLIALSLFSCASAEDSKENEEHSHTSEQVIVDSTCTEDGYEGYRCTECKEFESKTIIPKMGHAYEYSSVTPTCEEGGYVGEACVRCGHVSVEEELSPIGHSYTDWEVVSEPTEGEGGRLYSYCKNDGGHEREVILPPLNTTDYRFEIFSMPTALNGGLAGYVYEIDGTAFTFEKALPTESFVGGLFFVETETEAILVESALDITEVEIPASYNGKPVTEIGERAFCERTALTSVVIPNTVKKIGGSAFYGCTMLAELYIPGSVKVIDHYAFYECTSLAKLTLPFVGADEERGLQIEVVGDNGAGRLSIFNDGTLSALDTLIISGEGNEAFDELDFHFISEALNLNTLVINGSYKSIADDFLSFNNSLQNITVKGNIKNIGVDAFRYCTGLKEIDLSESAVEYIDFGAFTNCPNITTLKLPATVEKIDTTGLTSARRVDIESLSAWCGIDFGTSGNTKNPLASGAELYVAGELVTSVTLDGDFNTVGCYAFYCYSPLIELNITEGCGARIGDYAFFGTSITSLAIPSDAEFFGIGEWGFEHGGLSTFAKCFSLENVTFGEGFEAKELANTFENCVKLKSITIPASTELLFGTFADCKKLSEVKFAVDSNGVTSLKTIQAYAFKNCSALGEIHIPASVEKIGGGSFDGCTSIKKITLPFVGIQMGEPEGQRDSFELIFGHDSLYHLEEVTILNETTICTNAFREMTGVEKLTLPFVGRNNGIYDETTFVSMFSSDVNNLPETLKVVIVTDESWVPTSAFSGAKSIKEVSFENINSEFGYTRIGSGAFAACTSLEYFFISLEKSKPISVGANAFAGCSSMVSFRLPYAVDSIESRAFWNCTSLEYFEFISSDKGGYFGYYDDSEGIFEGCSSLHTVQNFPKTIEYIPAGLFKGCSSLQYIDLPTTIIEIGDSAFEGCSMLGGIDKLTSVERIGKRAFYGCQAIESFPGSDVLETIDREAFYGCLNMKLTALPESLESVGAFAFYECDSITISSLPKNLTSLEQKAFAGCEGIVSMVIPGSLDLISSYVFENCYNLQRVTVEEGVSTIGHDAFVGCSSMISIIVPSSVTVIGNTAFNRCYNLKVYLDLEEIPDDFSLVWNKFESIVLDYYLKGEWSLVGGIPTANT